MMMSYDQMTWNLMKYHNLYTYIIVIVSSMEHLVSTYLGRDQVDFSSAFVKKAKGKVS